MKKRLITIVFPVLLGACGVGSNQNGTPNVFVSPVSGPAAPLSKAEFSSLSPEQQYSVTNKLYGTLYKGVSAKDFFDFSKGTQTLHRKNATDPIQTFRQTLDARLSVDPDDPVSKTHSQYVAEIEEKYFTNPNTGEAIWAPLAIPTTYLYALPTSREYFDYWMAYQLTNNILFSPALELESVDDTDVYTVYSKLVYAISQDKPIREIVFEHMQTEENWRRFRSPEDNTREMMEIYLMRFNDAEVPPAAKACQNWRLSSDDQGYQLLKSTNFNTEAQTLLDTNNIVSCEDFMRTLSRHPSLIAGVTRRVVNQLMAGADETVRNNMVQGIVSARPETFRQLYSLLIYSRTYLLQAPRTKSAEETLFSVIDRLRWEASSDTFRRLNNLASEASYATLAKMSQAPMTYKLGRATEVPLDTLSFAYYHNQVRDVMLNEKSSSSHQGQGWQSSFYVDEELYLLDVDGFIDYLFLAMIDRKASDVERDELRLMIAELNSDNNRYRQTRLVMDYLSRLPELYAYRH